jgi:hypothetical protein
MQEQPDMKTKFLNDRWTQAAFDGNEFAQNLVSQEYGDFLSNYVDVPEEFVNPDERISYIQNEIFAQPEEGPSFYENINNPIEFLAARAALDENYNLEGEIANYNAARETTADDITAQMVRTYMEQMQPEQERLIDLGALGLPGGEVPIDDANKLMGILNTALNYRKFNQPQGQDYGPTIDGSPFGIEGQIPLKYASDIAALLKLNGGDSENSTIPNGWTYVKTNSNGVDIYSDQAGFLRRSSDLGYDTDPNGMYLQYNQDEGRYIPINPQEYFGLEGNNKNYWGDYEGPDFMKGKSFSEYLSGDNTQTKSSMDNIVSQFKEANPDLTYAQIAQRLSERDPVEFKQRTGLNLNAVRDRLRRMR